jgi:4-amino-4-deoxy-L-arabinose transferase-like glycosyltransferase
MKSPAVAIVLSALLCCAAVLSRPLLPPDETRYVTVAWESLQRGDFLVSHLNGATYAHKPPLLFWLINLAWAVFGSGDYVARCVAPLAGLVSIWLTWRLSLRLWPGQLERAAMASLIHASCMLWMFFSPVTMFDTLLTVCVQGALLGALRAASGDRRGLFQMAVGMGLGILSKGPVLLVFVLPVLLAGPICLPVQKRGPWLLRVALSVLGAAVVALAWAVPSAFSGGQEYANELLFGQTAGRMVNSFAHQQPFWFYLAVLPLSLLPWLLFGAVWRGMRGILSDGGARFAAVWLGGAFLVLSAVSGKQPYYILPAIPAAALLLAAAIDRQGNLLQGLEIVPVCIGTVLLGAVPLVVNTLPIFAGSGLPGLVSTTESLLLMAVAPVLLFRRRGRPLGVVTVTATSAVIFQVILVSALSDTLWSGFDLRPMAAFARETGRPTGWFGGYHGQLNYLGRIRSVAELMEEQDVAAWLQEHAAGQLIVRLKRAENELEHGLYGRLQVHDRRAVPAEQQAILATELKSVLDLPLESRLSRVVYAQWVRSGLRVQPYVIVEFEPER